MPATKIQKNWDLTLLYDGKKPSKEMIEKDVRNIERLYRTFAKKYNNRSDYLKDPKKLAATLKDYENLIKKTDSRSILYFAYRRELDSGDHEAEAMLNKLSDRLTKAGNETLFFTLKLGKLNKSTQKKMLESKHLTRYRYLLERIFETAKHDLSEAEEKIMNLKSLPARSLWVSGFEKVLNKQEVEFKKKKMPLSEAISRVPEFRRADDRRALWKKVLDTLESISDFAESELNAIAINKKINDELRGFKTPYSATVLSYENDEKEVENLIKEVSDRFSVAGRFYRLKKRMMGLKTLSYEDRAAPVGDIDEKITFPKALKTLEGVYDSLNPEYGEMLRSFVKNGQVDIYPKKGKTSGAFCSSSIGNPTYVLLNHTDDFRSMMTLAHEMGHAIHAERSKQQPPHYEGHTISVAETASTFFETATFNKLLDSMSEKEQMVALHDRIQDDIATIFRQIAFFNFELELHTRIREEGSLTKTDITKLLAKHLRKSLGQAVSVDDRDGYSFLYVSHFRRPFYVYTYAYGLLISKALYERYREDPSYIEKIDEFLSAGESKKPEDIFGDIGIDTRKKGFFAEGIKSIERDIDRLEKLVKKYYK